MSIDENIEDALKWLNNNGPDEREAVVRKINKAAAAYLYWQQTEATETRARRNIRNTLQEVNRSLNGTKKLLLRSDVGHILSVVADNEHDNASNALVQLSSKIDSLTKRGIYQSKGGRPKEQSGWVLVKTCHEIYEEQRLKDKKAPEKEKNKTPAANASTSGNFLSFVNAVGFVATGKEKNFEGSVKEYFNALKKNGDLL